MKKMNRFLSVFLVLTMLFAISVVNVSATENIEAWHDANNNGIIDENETTYTSFATVAKEGGEFKLNSDIVLTKNISLDDGVVLVVDLNGHSITASASITYAFYLGDYVHLTIKDSIGTGSVGGENIQYTIWVVGNSAVFTLEDGSINGTSSSLYFSESTATVNINGGLMVKPILLDGTLNIRGGTITNCIVNEGVTYYYGGDVTWDIRFGSLNFDPTPYLHSADSKLTEYDSATGLYTVYYNAVKYVRKTLKGTYVYNGTPQIPVLQLSHSHLGSLKNNVDYTLTITDNINAGTATVAIKYLMEQFRGTDTVTFTINPKDVIVKADDQSVAVGETLDGTALSATGLIDGHKAIATFVNSTENHGTSELVIDEVTITDAEGNDVTSNYNIAKENGILEVMMSDVSLHGEVKSFGDEAEEVTIEIFAENSEEAVETITLTGNNTNYFVEELENGNYTIRVSKLNHVTREYDVVIGENGAFQNVEINLLGDVDCNGTVNILDYTATLKHVKKTALLEGYAINCADVDGNGRVIITDYTAILRHVKKTESLW